MAGSPRIIIRPTTRSRQPAAVLAAVKDKPSAALKKRRPRPPLRATAMEICGRGGRMLAARVEQKNGMTEEDKNGVILPLLYPYEVSDAVVPTSSALRSK